MMTAFDMQEQDESVSEFLEEETLKESIAEAFVGLLKSRKYSYLYGFGKYKAHF
jgi:hypothetical protein